jgi:hypothetical protein
VAFATFPEHAGLQLRAQFSDIHAVVEPLQRPCVAHDAHDGFRSTPTHDEPTSGDGPFGAICCDGFS